jgi:hypothetical protein
MLLLQGRYRLCGSYARQNQRNASGEDRNYSDHGTNLRSGSLLISLYIAVRFLPRYRHCLPVGLSLFPGPRKRITADYFRLRLVGVSGFCCTVCLFATQVDFVAAIGARGVRFLNTNALRGIAKGRLRNG